MERQQLQRVLPDVLEVLAYECLHFRVGVVGERVPQIFGSDGAPRLQGPPEEDAYPHSQPRDHDPREQTGSE